MYFRNLTLFRFSSDVSADLNGLDDALAQHRLRDVGPIEFATHGFVSPLGRASEQLTLNLSHWTLFAAGGQDKLLPAAVVNDDVARRIQKIAEEEDRKVNGRERKRLKDEVLHELLQRAFVRSSRLLAYVDVARGWLVVDSSSRKAAENLVSLVREALGSFPVVPLTPEESPRALLTDWLAGGHMPAGFSLGEECELRDPATAIGAIARIRRQDMEAEEIREHLRSGKQVFSLGLVFDDRLSFVLGEDLSVKRVQLLDVVLDQLDSSAETIEQETTARFALFTAEISRLLERLAEIFKLPRPE